MCRASRGANAGVVGGEQGNSGADQPYPAHRSRPQSLVRAAGVAVLYNPDPIHWGPACRVSNRKMVLWISTTPTTCGIQWTRGRHRPGTGDPDFHGERSPNRVHRSVTHPDACRLGKKWLLRLRPAAAVGAPGTHPIDLLSAQPKECQGLDGARSIGGAEIR